MELFNSFYGKGTVEGANSSGYRSGHSTGAYRTYNVIAQDGDGNSVLLAPGWTLRDAIETFCEWFHVERERICILRPFFPQS